VTSASPDEDLDRVFKALGDRTRRMLLDLLRQRNGQTLGELCARLDMARQSASQHLSVLEQANLISTVRRGRAKLHYLNPVPIHQLQQRWVAAFEQPRLQALSELKRRSEENAMSGQPDGAERPSYVYVTYIQATPQDVWSALTSAELTARYWGHANVSDWEPGSSWEHRRVDGSQVADVLGTVLAATPPRQLRITFDAPGVEPAGGPSVVTFDIEPHHDIVRVTVTHQNLPDQEALGLISLGWPAVLANLKSLLETGKVLTTPPWEMSPGHQPAQ
jgi:uncharacterized protein YndB with AHSA1/START domain